MSQTFRNIPGKHDGVDSNTGKYRPSGNIVMARHTHGVLCEALSQERGVLRVEPEDVFRSGDSCEIGNPKYERGPLFVLEPRSGVYVLVSTVNQIEQINPESGLPTLSEDAPVNFVDLNRCGASFEVTFQHPTPTIAAFVHLRTDLNHRSLSDLKFNEGTGEYTYHGGIYYACVNVQGIAGEGDELSFVQTSPASFVAEMLARADTIVRAVDGLSQNQALIDAWHSFEVRQHTKRISTTNPHRHAIMGWLDVFEENARRFLGSNADLINALRFVLPKPTTDPSPTID